MMQSGKMKFIKNWGLGHFLYAYILLKLRHYFGFRISLVRTNEIKDSGLTSFESNNYVFKIINHQDLRRASENNALDLSPIFVDKSETKDDQCLGVLHDQQLVGYTWRTTNPVEIDSGIWLEFGDKVFYRYKSFVLPEHRGKNLLNQIKKLSEKHQLDQGRLNSVSCIETHNYPSIKASTKSGDKTIGYSLFIKNRFGFYSWNSSGARALGVRVYQENK